MLIEFTVENYKSFRDKTTFSMVAAPIHSEDTRLDHDNVLSISTNLSLLRSAALYGANASGKSNLGAAMRFMQNLVLFSTAELQGVAGIAVEPFLFSTETQDKPSLFEMVFRVDDRQYRYGFEVSRQEVVAEWLFHVPKTKEVALFLRDSQNIEVKTAFKEGKGLEERTRPNALFLSVAAQFNVQTARRLQHWFRNVTITTGLQDDYRGLTMMWLRDNASKQSVVNLLSEMNLGFQNVEVFDPLIVDSLSLPSEWSEDVRQKVAADLVKRINTVHPVLDPDGNQVSIVTLNLDVHESQGTRKLVALAGLLLSHLNLGFPLFIDELDARLHPLMTRRIIEMFHSPEANPKGAQLIFATHDTNVLDRALFRRDQIWFAEKDRQGATHLYSLAEYRPRNDAAFEKNYLAGRYGAIPYLGDLSRLPGTLEEAAVE
jgi:AAA15 family ATPase/GTPase